MSVTKVQRRSKIRKRIRSRMFGDANRPRLSVFRSNKQIYAQVIDDLAGTTLVSASSLQIESAEGDTKTDIAKKVGNKLAELAKQKNISQVVFDRSGYLYHGRVKALADGAREGGLKL